MSVTFLTDNNIPNKHKIVLKFSAEWCVPCKKISPIFKELAKEHPNIHFYESDVDSNQYLAQKYNITAMPTFVFIKDKVEIIRLQGVNEKKLKHNLNIFEAFSS